MFTFFWSIIVSFVNLFIFSQKIKAQLPDPKTYKQHFENKHPKAEMPAEIKDVVAWQNKEENN